MDTGVRNWAERVDPARLAAPDTANKACNSDPVTVQAAATYHTALTVGEARTT
jgi:hypothetical protein